MSHLNTAFSKVNPFEHNLLSHSTRCNLLRAKKMRSWASKSHSCSPLMICSSICWRIGDVPLYRSPSWSDKDKASLHKVAGRTWAAQRQSTCQQSHRAPGTHSSLHRLSASSFRLLIHSFPLTFSPFLFLLLLCHCLFSPSLPFLPIIPPPSPFLSGRVMHPTFLLPFGIRLKRQAEGERCSKSLVVLIESIILLMFCHCCCTLLWEAQC